MTVRTLVLAVFLVAPAAQLVIADPLQPAKQVGRAVWAKDFPKVKNGAVEVLGQYDEHPGYTVEKVTLRYLPAEGGELRSEPLHYADGSWGKKMDNKIVPKSQQLPQGKWMVQAVIVYQPKDGGPAVEYGTQWAVVEVR